MAALTIARSQAIAAGELAMLGDVAVYNNDGEYIALAIIQEDCPSVESALSQANDQVRAWTDDTDAATALQTGVRNTSYRLDTLLDAIALGKTFGHEDRVNEAIEDLDTILASLQELIPA